MPLPDRVVDLLVGFARRLVDGTTEPNDQAVSDLFYLVMQRPVLNGLVELLRDGSDTAEARGRLQQATESEASADPVFGHQLAAAVARVQGDDSSQRHVTSTITIGGQASGPIDVTTAGGNVIRGNRNHIGDKIKNIHKTTNGRVGIAVVLVVVVAVGAWLAFGNSGAPGSGASVSTTSVEDVVATSGASTEPTSATTTAPPLASGAQLHVGSKDYNAGSNGHVLVVTTSEFGSDTTLATIDIATGDRLGGFTIPGYVDPTYNTKPKCGFTVVRRSDGTNLVLNFEIEVVAAQGTIEASSTRKLVARKAEDGTLLWTATSKPKPLPGSAIKKSGSGCNGPLDPGSVSADSTHLWVNFRNDEGYFSVSLSDGKTLPIPGSDKLLGSHAIVTVNGASAAAGGPPDYVKLINLADGSEAGRVTEPEVARTMASQYATAVSPDGKVLIQETRDRGLVAFGFPSMAVLWTQRDHRDVDDMRIDLASKVIVSSPFGGVSERKLIGESLQTGAKLWEIEQINESCGEWNGKAYVLANRQFAVIDLATGKQLSFDPSIAKCPVILDGVMIRQDITGSPAIKL